jgi:hypothetical protein
MKVQVAVVTDGDVKQTVFSWQQIQGVQLKSGPSTKP